MDAATTRRERHRLAVRRRLVISARLALAHDGTVTPRIVADICEQNGVHPSAFRAFFDSHDDLLDAVNDLLVEECADRLRDGVAAFTPPAVDAIEAAARAIAESWPIERGGVIIRAQRRLHGLVSPEQTQPVVAAEKRFALAVTQILADLLQRLGRRFDWSPVLAVRIILDSYERSFEAWILKGHSETSFVESPYVTRTLPELLRRTSVEGG